MTHAQQMLRAHPIAPKVDLTILTECIQECFDCAQTCTSCADACLSDQHVQMLIRCIRLNQDCADVCNITGNMLSRQTHPDWTLLRMQVQTCAESCRVCGDECERHASMHQHCAVCADACRRCEQACKRLITALPS